MKGFARFLVAQFRQTARHQTRSATRFLCAAILALGFSACLAGPEATQDVTDAFIPNVSPVPEVSPVAVAPGCVADRFRQPDAVITKKVDLLFLTDTSSSLSQERMHVARGVAAFIAALPADVDYRVATMLAHGEKTGYAGRIYSHQRSGSAKVLRSDLLTPEQIQTELIDDLAHVRNDNETDGGEIGTYSLTRALDDDRLAENRALGFFREDAALAVVMISDENDICADFPAGVVPVRDPQGLEAASKRKYCTRTAPAHVVNGIVLAPSYEERITPKSVVTRLQNLQADRPLVVAAIAYTDPARLPPGAENEVGYGWLDMVTLTNGVKVEMADGSYETGLSRIGALTSVKLNLQKEFPLSQSTAKIDRSTIEARVDGASVGFTYLSDLNQVSLDALGTAGSTIDLLYCEPRPEPSPTPHPTPSPTPSRVPGVDALCSEGSFIPKASLRVGLAIDPAEGSITSIVNGLTAILGSAPTVYTDAEIAGGALLADGVTVLAVSRKVVVQSGAAAFVAAVKDFIAGGGSVIAEYDGAAMFFRSYEGLNVSYEGHFSRNLGLFDGNVAGGGLLIPTTYSAAFVVDPTHPIWLGVPSPLATGTRAAFAVTNYPTWLEPVASFSASGLSGGIPLGSYPAALASRCGSGRIVLFPMNHFQVLSNAGVKTLVTNAFNWVIGR